MELQIIAGEYMPYCKKYVIGELGPLTRRGIGVAWTEKPPGVLRCRLTGRPNRVSAERVIILKWAVARGVALLIAKHWDKVLQWSVRPYGLLLEDWGLERLKQHVDALPGLTATLSGLVRRRATEFLDESPVLHLHGFVRFRLRDAAAYLTGAVERVLDALLVQQEDTEYINLLRNVALRRRSCANTVHVVVYNDSHYILYNESMQSIDVPVAASLGEESKPGEDALIAALIHLAPQTVVVHGAQAVPFAAHTLREVFGAAFSECPGCRLCKIGSR
ncbi:MAG: sporulation protein YtxC [Desulfotomaculales bacterium]